VAKFINYIMERGKKNAARAIVYGAFEDLRKGGAADPLEVFEEAIKNIGPLMEVRSRRIGGANYQVPREVSPQRRLALAMRWLIEAAESRKGSPMRTRLKEELSAASKKEGEAVKRRENTHKMAEANRAFAHFSW
jgi:small subunit ribosomal protein S7